MCDQSVITCVYKQCEVNNEGVVCDFQFYKIRFSTYFSLSNSIFFFKLKHRVCECTRELLTETSLESNIWHQELGSCSSIVKFNHGQFPTNLPILDNKNYDKWIKQMKLLFSYQDVMGQVSNGVDPITNSSIDAH